jgi:Raf kinase inhibitor-like YbhB/YbcL family protein
MRRILVSACFLLAAGSAVCAQTPSPAPAGAPAPRPPPLILSSPVMQDGGVIPDKYTIVSQSPVSPPLTWTNVPATAQSLVLIVHDVDVVMQKGMGDNPHWIVFNIPASVTSLAEAQPATPTLANGAVQMTRKNAQGAVANVGFAPPGPPPGFFHHYDFDLYALDTKLALDTNASRADIEAAMAGHIVGKGVIQTRFKR